MTARTKQTKLFKIQEKALQIAMPFLVPPCGIEPQPTEPESVILSIKLWGPIFIGLQIYIFILDIFIKFVCLVLFM